ncbi:MAG: hypothetical protein AABO58_04060 [Acidobacteriota bacterium]
MGVAVWLVAGGAAFFVARIVPAGRRTVLEAIAAIVAAVGAGVAATALDFGGWNEPDWRAGLFVFCCAATVIALIRLIRLAG